MAVDVRTGKHKALTPTSGVAARILHVSPQRPREILVGLNDRDAKWHDVYRVNIASGKRTLVRRNEDGVMTFLADDGYTYLGYPPTDLLVRNGCS